MKPTLQSFRVMFLAGFMGLMAQAGGYSTENVLNKALKATVSKG